MIVKEDQNNSSLERSLQVKSKNAELIRTMNNDEVVALNTNRERNELYDYMVENGIEPCDYGTNGKDIWLA